MKFNHSSDIDFQDFMNVIKKCTTKSYSFLVIDSTLASEISSCFRKSLLERKVKYSINREAAQISALSSVKTDKYKFHKGEEILPSDQRRRIEQAKFTCSPLDKAFENQIKTIEDQGEKTNKSTCRLLKKVD